ncbi:MAG TPA: 23S rRNA (adenine(2503)-C(2))-methyltransferase RlmN [Acidimicrobiales bacterium]|nr:23S rRNA (adenine(2503)-C(2))-methyltransferase RlmN [Acidimicrobiales bacterium]
MSRYDLSREELAEVLAGEPAYRVAQLEEGLYRRLALPGELTTLPKTLRERLAADERLAPALSLRTEQRADDGATTKWLFALDGGHAVETVLMHYPRHSTVCISSQAGCAMACTFCATGDHGFDRQLRVGEIVEQVVHAARRAREEGRRLDHVVFMGMGEPLANLGPVLTAVERLVGPLGLAQRHLTISTVGVVPGIRRLAARPEQVNLAVSLHAANDALRDELVPLNRRYPLAVLLAACAEYVAATHRRLSFEWALIDGVNDRDADAGELATIARELHAHVNLIPMNPTVGGSARGLRGSPPTRVRGFRDELRELGVNVTIRQTRGEKINAACGQLAGAVARSATGRGCAQPAASPASPPSPAVTSLNRPDR